MRLLMELQALRRVDTGDLRRPEARLALMRLEEAMTELRQRFDLDARDLNPRSRPSWDHYYPRLIRRCGATGAASVKRKWRQVV
jgi:gas vesicle protein GvpK